MFGANFMFGSLSKIYGIASCRGIVYLGKPARAPGKTIKEWFFCEKVRAFSKIKPKLPSISERERGDHLMIPSLQPHRHFGTSQTAIVGWNILMRGVIPYRTVIDNINSSKSMLFVQYR
ncbi:hypothetical protein CDAR_203881 [Caerostris darwini]|uniref:Uncharacterized protein n=1 Tax=Caerostris darwini TaxID=1538125 RepID=A0AAV4P9B1_9ARAC|nr:hypothetical protein CDAR_203881 [Caerostris darwini]